MKEKDHETTVHPAERRSATMLPWRDDERGEGFVSGADSAVFSNQCSIKRVLQARLLLSLVCRCSESVWINISMLVHAAAAQRRPPHGELQEFCSPGRDTPGRTDKRNLTYEASLNYGAWSIEGGAGEERAHGVSEKQKLDATTTHPNRILTMGHPHLNPPKKASPPNTSCAGAKQLFGTNEQPQTKQRPLTQT